MGQFREIVTIITLFLYPFLCAGRDAIPVIYTSVHGKWWHGVGFCTRAMIAIALLLTWQHLGMLFLTEMLLAYGMYFNLVFDLCYNYFRFGKSYIFFVGSTAYSDKLARVIFSTKEPNIFLYHFCKFIGLILLIAEIYTIHS